MCNSIKATGIWNTRFLKLVKNRQCFLFNGGNVKVTFRRNEQIFVSALLAISLNGTLNEKLNTPKDILKLC